MPDLGRQLVQICIRRKRDAASMYTENVGPAL